MGRFAGRVRLRPRLTARVNAEGGGALTGRTRRRQPGVGDVPSVGAVGFPRTSHDLRLSPLSVVAPSRPLPQLTVSLTLSFATM